MNRVIALLLSLMMICCALPALAEQAGPSPEEMAASLLESKAAKEKDAWMLAILGRLEPGVLPGAG